MNGSSAVPRTFAPSHREDGDSPDRLRADGRRRSVLGRRHELFSAVARVSAADRAQCQGRRPLLELHHEVLVPATLGHCGGASLPERMESPLRAIVDDLERQMDDAGFD